MVDASEAAELASIDASFHDLDTVDPMTLRHPDPKKKDLIVVEVSMGPARLRSWMV